MIHGQQNVKKKPDTFPSSDTRGDTEKEIISITAQYASVQGTYPEDSDCRFL
jgi:hypothetical protein